MKILRGIVAVVVGYVLFAGASMWLVRFGPVMTQQGPLMVVVVLVALALIGVVVGLNARIIAGDHFPRGDRLSVRSLGSADLIESLSTG